MVRWQTFLARQGFFKGEAQGNFGPLTQRATADFQAAYGLSVDGVAGKTTLRVAREVGYSDSISAKTEVNRSKTNANCCACISAALSGERFPQTRRSVLSNEEIRQIDDASLRYAINEMYARHGLTFRDPAWQREFCSRTWYRPNTAMTQGQSERLMSAIEQGNVQALARERAARRANSALRVAPRTSPTQ